MSGFAPYTYGDGAYGDRRDADTLLSMSHETKRRHAEKQKAPTHVGARACLILFQSQPASTLPLFTMSSERIAAR